MGLAAKFIYALGSLVCHQIPERSFYLSGVQLPVCARCTGLYLSGAAGFSAWLLLKAARGWTSLGVEPTRALRLVVVAALPTAITFATGVSGLWDGSNLTRAVLAVPLGAAAGGIVAAVLTKDLR